MTMMKKVQTGGHDITKQPKMKRDQMKRKNVMKIKLSKIQTV